MTAHQVRSGWRLAAIAVAIAGIGLRLVALGRHGFWNDEAWVAITTRVTGSQWGLALSVTPIGWAYLLRIVPSSLPAEWALRAVPFLFGCATLVIAHRVGRTLAGPLGGLLALTAVAFDPLEIAFAKQLKPYTAEGFFALLALERLVVATRTRRSAAIWWLAVVLCVGSAFATSQLLVAAAFMPALLIGVIGARDRRLLAHAIAACVCVAVWSAAWFTMMVAPRLGPEMHGFWRGNFMPQHSLGAAARFVHAQLALGLGDALGRSGWLVGLAACVLACIVDSSFRPAAVAIGLLTAELLALGYAGRFPWALRLMLFYYTAALVVLSSAIAHVVRAASVKRALIGPAVAVLALVVADAVRQHDWRHLADSPRIEDVGPLIQEMEAERGPDDVVLVYRRTVFVYAYYQRAVPVLDPFPNAAGWLPQITDPRIVLVDDTSLDAAVQRAFADGRSVWFVGSRLGSYVLSLETTLRRRGTVTDRKMKQDALLLHAVPRAK